MGQPAGGSASRGVDAGKEVKVPYRRLGDLPKGVRDNVPKHAQEIYRAAFNSAWDEYGHDEERAHRIAWAAVKEKYEKNEKTGKWKAKPKTTKTR